MGFLSNLGTHLEINNWEGWIHSTVGGVISLCPTQYNNNNVYWYFHNISLIIFNWEIFSWFFLFSFSDICFTLNLIPWYLFVNYFESGLDEFFQNTLKKFKRLQKLYYGKGIHMIPNLNCSCLIPVEWPAPFIMGWEGVTSCDTRACFSNPPKYLLSRAIDRLSHKHWALKLLLVYSKRLKDLSKLQMKAILTGLTANMDLGFESD